MAVIIYIILAVLLIVLIIRLILAWWNMRVIKERFRNDNVIVTGKQGKGKDVLFQAVIKSRKEQYHANLNYGYKFKPKEFSELTVTPNTYQDFINGKITKIAKTEGDGIDYYLSDGGLYLPSQYDTLLHKRYPSFPIYYALSRQLYLQHIHINVQNIERLWKAIREQADFYIACKNVKKYPFFLKVEFITYEKYESLKQNLLPMGNRFFNKFSKAEQDRYKATNGEIKRRYIYILKKSIKYDTREFANKIFNNIDPKTKQITDNVA